jgi:glutamine synthetase
VDEKGQNVFAGNPISPLFRNALGGLRDSMGDFMAVWAQSANAYRRYQPKSYVPMAAHWGYNNRTASLRVLNSSANATRVEHRIAGSDANPYLVVAAVLAGIHHGIVNKLEPGPAAEGNCDSSNAPKVPTAWVNALAQFRASRVVTESFGAVFQKTFADMKETERREFERVVTALDHQWYARVA